MSLMPKTTIFPTKAHPAMPYRKFIRLLNASMFLFALLGAPLRSTLEAGSQQRETPVVIAVRRARSAVVNISSEKRVDGRSVWDGALSETPRVNGMGSGIIIDAHGYIITNAHVVDRVTSLRV